MARRRDTPRAKFNPPSGPAPCGSSSAGQESEHSRVGIITTKRIGHAVLRNLLRRRVREMVREHGVPIARGFYVVLVLRNRAAFSDYRQLEADFLKLLTRQLRRRTAC